MALTILPTSQNGVVAPSQALTRPSPHMLISNSSSTYYTGGIYLKSINTAEYPKQIPVTFYTTAVNGTQTTTATLGTAFYRGVTATLYATTLPTGTNYISATWPGESRWAGFTTTMTTSIVCNSASIFSGNLSLTSSQNPINEFDSFNLTLTSSAGSSMSGSVTLDELITTTNNQYTTSSQFVIDHAYDIYAYQTNYPNWYLRQAGTGLNRFFDGDLIPTDNSSITETVPMYFYNPATGVRSSKSYILYRDDYFSWPAVYASGYSSIPLVGVVDSIFGGVPTTPGVDMQLIVGSFQNIVNTVTTYTTVSNFLSSSEFVNGIATFTNVSLASIPGNHVLQATWNGGYVDGTPYLATNSNSIVEIVNPISLTLTANSSTVSTSQTLTLTAKLNDSTIFNGTTITISQPSYSFNSTTISTGTSNTSSFVVIGSAANSLSTSNVTITSSTIITATTNLSLTNNISVDKIITTTTSIITETQYEGRLLQSIPDNTTYTLIGANLSTSSNEITVTYLPGTLPYFNPQGHYFTVARNSTTWHVIVSLEVDNIWNVVAVPASDSGFTGFNASDYPLIIGDVITFISIANPIVTVTPTTTTNVTTQTSLISVPETTLPLVNNSATFTILASELSSAPYPFQVTATWNGPSYVLNYYLNPIVSNITTFTITN